MGIFRFKDKNGRPHGPWLIQYPHRRDPVTGRVIYTTRTAGPSKRVAQRMLAKMLLEWEQRKVRGQDRVKPQTVAQLTDWYLSLPEVRAKRSYEDDVQRVKMIKAELGSLMAHELDAKALTNWRARMLQKKSSFGRPYAPGTVNRLMDTIKRMYNLAQRDGLQERNPCWKVRALPENNQRDRVVTPEEFRALFRELAPYARMPILTAYLTGMRIGEVLSLTWAQVDQTTGMFDLPRAKTKTNQPRLVPIPGPVLEWLAKQDSSDPQGWVFQRDGQPLGNLGKGFKSACQRAGIPAAVIHDLRHSFVTLLRRAGVERSIIMKVTGHQTDKMFDRYNKVDLEETTQAVGQMADICGSAQD